MGLQSRAWTGQAAIYQVLEALVGEEAAQQAKSMARTMDEDAAGEEKFEEDEISDSDSDSDDDDDDDEVARWAAAARALEQSTPEGRTTILAPAAAERNPFPAGGTGARR